MSSITDAARLVTETVVASLREQYPYMRTDAVLQAAQQCGLVITSTIAKEQPEIEAAKTRISFMSLSPELRNRIYELTVVRTGAEDCKEPSAIFVSTRSQQNPWHQQPALTRVSKQIRAESLPVYYGLNHFEIDAGYERASMCNRGLLVDMLGKMVDLLIAFPSPLSFPLVQDGVGWLECIGGTNARLIRRLTVRQVKSGSVAGIGNCDRQFLLHQLCTKGLDNTTIMARLEDEQEIILRQ